jgi:hypothetical protein
MHIVHIVELTPEQAAFLLANRRIRPATHYDVQAAYNCGRLVFRNMSTFTLFVE